ncbi:MAG: RsbRD N-terminal domain-containing protein [Desulfovibrionaceae bacterium]|nr:RsbRD N-terminal domain-containing protein [Desulfovibrionaceae bacterium]
MRDRREEIAGNWLDAIYKTYPLDTTGFLRNKKDQWGNPIAHRTERAVNGLIDALFAEGLDSDVVMPLLDDIVRIRGVQDFTASQAVGVVFFLKTILRKAAGRALDEPGAARQLLELESKIDSLALISFDIYTKCRDLIADMKVQEFKHSHYRLLQKAGLILGEPAEEPEPNHN